MEHRVAQTAHGWIVLHAEPDADNGAPVAGPFSDRQQAIDWIIQRGQAAEHEQQAAAAKSRAELLSETGLVAALKDAIKNPPPAPSGRPSPAQYQAECIAIEYYWRVRARKKQAPVKDALIVAELEREFNCSADFVRKCRKNYAPIANYDDDLLTQLRCQALERQLQVSGPFPVASAHSKLEKAQQFLREALTDGPVLADQIYRNGKAAGHSESTLDRAKKLLVITSVRNGTGWAWCLPSSRVSEV